MVFSRRLSAVALAGVLVMTAAGCSSDKPSNPIGVASTQAAPGTADHSAADVEFLTSMVPHHAQAVRMADVMLAKKDLSPEVRTLAQKIKDAQGPEIQQMQSLLAKWGAPAAPTGHAHDGANDMAGMVSEDAIERLGEWPIDRAEPAFLDLMSAHHTGALQMASTASKMVTNPEVQALAQRIFENQQSEIAEMRKLLAK